MSLMTAGQASASTQMRMGPMEARIAAGKKKPPEGGFQVWLELAPQGGGEGN
jgi:hypothetical protein